MVTNRTISILVVDDEVEICRNCMKILAKLGYNVEYALDGIQAIDMIRSNRFDIVITDLNMNGIGGMEVISKVKASFPKIIIIVITGYASVSSAVEVMKTGAFDYLPKPFTPYELRGVVQQAVEKLKSYSGKSGLRGTDARKKISHQLIGDSEEIKKVIKMVKKVAPTDSTVCIYGKSGTGKELIARAIHANSKRRDKVFFAVDCGTLSGELLSSELFGHVKGAFTGAYKEKPGIFRLAHGGTVFLDEIANTTIEIQNRLLRFLETMEFMPVGGSKIVKVNVRLIFATNKRLETLVKQGRFREDFYYRIFVYPIVMPTLKQRKEDILPIALFFLRQFCGKMEKKIEGFHEEAAHYLMEYNWPGNVRQLKNVVERAVIMCETNLITLKDLPLFDKLDDIYGLDEVYETDNIDELSGIDNLPLNIPKTNEDFKVLKKEIRQRAINKVERDFIINALVDNDWNVTKAARETGLQRTNFQALIRKHKISRPS